MIIMCSVSATLASEQKLFSPDGDKRQKSETLRTAEGPFTPRQNKLLSIHSGKRVESYIFNRFG